MNGNNKGIIQQVFERYYRGQLGSIKNLEQELIEAINKYELFYLKDYGAPTHYVMKRSLIGDAYQE